MLTRLGHGEVSRVQDFPIHPNGIAEVLECRDKGVENLPVLSLSDSADILEDETARIEFVNKPRKMQDEPIARIVERASAHHREPLGWCAPEDAVDGLITKTRTGANVLPRKLHNRGADHRSLWKIERVSRAVDRIDINGRGNVEARLFEAQTDPPNPTEQIDANRSTGVLVCCPCPQFMLPAGLRLRQCVYVFIGMRRF